MFITKYVDYKTEEKFVKKIKQTKFHRIVSQLFYHSYCFNSLHRKIKT